MIFKRILSWMIVFICVISVFCVPFAADSGDEIENEIDMEEDTVPTETVKPTKAPEPTITMDAMGHDQYVQYLERTVYDGELGAIYSKRGTIFHLWSPKADSVRVCIYKTGSDSEEGAQLVSTNLMKLNRANGTWYITLKGDYKNLYYTYQVTVEGKTNEVVDPYAKAVGVNGDRGMIVDLKDTNPKGWAKDSFDRVPYLTDAVVWEISVRDFSASESSGVSAERRGKYLAFAEGATTVNGVEGELSTCVAYLKKMGVNYVQINPFYDFASIDESAPLDSQYNWGYDPKNYNVPEGSYSTNPYDGRVRIKECKKMIQSLHKAGIGVIMDVVYNHTYESENSFFNQIVPNYYYRMSDSGDWSNGSGCGNDIATERYMMRRFIRDSVTYWVSEYHIDGFRFDLMGLMDVDTMNTVRDAVSALPGGKRVLMYGEAWDMQTACDSSVRLANQSNVSLLKNGIGAFNDSGRDGIKGNNFNAVEGGFVQEGSSKSGVRDCIEGQTSGWAKIPNQCVNYVSCHDNLTLYDKLTASVYNDKKYNRRREDLVAMNKLAASIVFTSRGMPFLLAGEEMGRTKLGDENSYRSSVEINQIDWNNLHQYTSLTEYYQGLITLRKKLDILRDPTGNNTSMSYIESDSKGVIAYQLSSADQSTTAVMVFNGDKTASGSVTLPKGEWVKVADDKTAGIYSLGEYSGDITVPATSCAVFINKSAFAQLGEERDLCDLYVQYTDVNDNTVVYEDHISGAEGESYAVSIPEHITFTYDVTSSDDVLQGEFKPGINTITINCNPYEGDFSTVTFRFKDDRGNEIANAIVLTNRIGQQYYTPALPSISGFVLDLDNLPKNGAGKFTEEEIEVVYHYTDEPLISSVDPEYSSSANVLYMGSNGEILEKKSYMGTEGSVIDVSMFEFKGYKLVSVSNEGASFAEAQTNIIVNYEKKGTSLLIYVFIAAGAIALIAIASVIYGSSGKRRKMSAIDIDDE